MNRLFSVRKHLKFNVLRTLNVLLHEDALVAEGRLRTRLAQLECTLEFIRFFDDLHADATAARSRFDDDRVADFIRQRTGDVGACNGFRRTFGRGQTRRFHGCSGLNFVAEERDDFRGRSDERDALFLQPGHKGSVLGQETVAGVDGIALQFLRRLNHRFDVQVGIKRVGPVVGIGDVGHLNGKRQSVLPAVDDGGFNVHVAEGAEDAKGDFATVGDQHAFESHGGALTDSIYEQSGRLRRVHCV